MSEVLNRFLEKVKSQPSSISFEESMQVVNDCYSFTPTAFRIGNDEAEAQRNEQGQNEGSCKLVGFAQLHDLTDEQALHLFGDYYREVLEDPNGSAHGNIRALMRFGVKGAQFDTSPLSPL